LPALPGILPGSIKDLRQECRKGRAGSPSSRLFLLRDTGDSIVLVDLVSLSNLDTLEACHPSQPGRLSSKENAGGRLCALSGI